MNKIENRKTAEKMKYRVVSLRKISKIGKPLARLAKTKRDKTNITSIKNGTQAITAGSEAIEKGIKNINKIVCSIHISRVCRQLCSHKVANLPEMD